LAASPQHAETIRRSLRIVVIPENGLMTPNV